MAEEKGWMEEKVQEGWGSSPSEKMPFEVDTEIPVGRGRRTMADEDAEGETEVVMFIPDLDEQAEEDIVLQVAEPPKQKAVKLPTMEELDAALVGMVSTVAMEDGKRIDLSCLTEHLMPKNFVDEDMNEVWEFDSLLRTVTNEMTADQDAAISAKLREEGEEQNVTLDFYDDALATLNKRQAKGGRRGPAPQKTKSAEEEDDDDQEKRMSTESDKPQQKVEAAPLRPPPKGGRRGPSKNKKIDPPPTDVAESKDEPDQSLENKDSSFKDEVENFAG